MLTAEGRLLHNRVHEQDSEMRRDLRIARGLRLRSLRFGLIGQADVVEFQRVDGSDAGIPLVAIEGFWQPFVVEYKRGKPKVDRCDEIQVCAQAVCLEEMLGASMRESAIFYGSPRRRHQVCLDTELHQEMENVVRAVRSLLELRLTPAPEYHKGCRSCSLVTACMPKLLAGSGSVRAYLERALEGDGD